MDNILKSMKLNTWLKTIKLEEGNIQHQCRRTNITYSHIHSIYKHFQDCGLIHMSKIGRQYKIKLTERGQKLKKLFEEIEKTIGDVHGKANRIGEV